jgi:outer membrane lipoprotein SlyB
MFTPKRKNGKERSAASIGASIGASLGGKSGPFGAGIGAGFGGAVGYIAGALTPGCSGKRLLPDGGQSDARDGRRDEGVAIPVDEE